MSMKEDIISILTEYRDRLYEGNSDQAARSLGVNPPTFWRWLNGVNVPKVDTISKAFDRINARIVLPGKDGVAEHQELEKLRGKVEELTRICENQQETIAAQKESLRLYRERDDPPSRNSDYVGNDAPTLPHVARLSRGENE